MLIKKTFSFAFTLINYKLRFKIKSLIEGLLKEYFIILFAYAFANAISVIFNTFNAF
jgi:hypothetical protein